MCCLGIDYHRGCLHCGNNELEGGYVGLISMELMSIGALIEACLHHMAKAPTVQASRF
jgi:hypothetical protein